MSFLLHIFPCDTPSKSLSFRTSLSKDFKLKSGERLEWTQQFCAYDYNKPYAVIARGQATAIIEENFYEGRRQHYVTIESTNPKDLYDLMQEVVKMLGGEVITIAPESVVIIPPKLTAIWNKFQNFLSTIKIKWQKEKPYFMN